MLLIGIISPLECRQERGRSEIKQLIKFEMLWLSGKWKQVAIRFINFFQCFEQIFLNPEEVFFIGEVFCFVVFFGGERGGEVEWWV